MGFYYTDEGTQVLDRDYIHRNLAGSRDCERCNRNLIEHTWIELGDEGFVIKCSFSDTKTDPTQKSNEYVCFNEYGSIEMRVPKDTLEGLLAYYEQTGTLALNCWELRREGEEIHARLAPQCLFDGRDNLWREFVAFVPYIP